MANRGKAAGGTLGAIAGCLLLSACAADAPGAHALIPERSAAAQATVVVHMSGLMLVVPPGQDGGRTHVLLPAAAGHAARLGFGITGDEPYVQRLCLTDEAHGLPAIRAGVCYVDLERWALQPFGDGGPPTPAANTLPAGVLNAAEVSGGEYRVDLASLGSELRAQVALTAGQVGGQCSLASWIVEPVEAAGGPRRRELLPLANVLSWEIRNPAAAELVFRSRSGPETVTVPLPPPAANGKIEILLSHGPLDELDDLPPAIPARPAAAPDTAYHFGAYYDLLRGPGTGGKPMAPGSPNRRLPHTPSALSPRACDVRITTPARRMAHELPPFAHTLAMLGNFRPFRSPGARPANERASTVVRASLATYACILGGG
jgi:hypothetical protein